MSPFENTFNIYSVSGLNHDFQEGPDFGYRLNHIRDEGEWNYNKKFHNGEVSYMGVLPKDWPSDENIYEKVCERLFRDHLVDAAEIKIEVDQGIVTLTGLVSDRFAKNNAEKCIEDVFGVVDIQNRLEIKPDRGLIGRSDGPIGASSV